MLNNHKQDIELGKKTINDIRKKYGLEPIKGGEQMCQLIEKKNKLEV